MKWRSINRIFLSTLALACSAGERGTGGLGPGAPGDDGTGGSSSHAADGGSGTASSAPGHDAPGDAETSDAGGTSNTDGGGADDGATSDDGGVQFDVQPDDDPGGGSGCEKIDFVFVIDNSGSMGDDQQKLVDAFPGFVSEIQAQVQGQDHRIMVLDSDSHGWTTCGDPNCCASQCGYYPQLAWCNDVPCGPITCDMTLGAGKLTDPNLNPCGVVGGKRWMTHAQPDLLDTFTCLATVGVKGDGAERPISAAVEAVTTLNDPGQCNEGFLRDDAILVLTFVTDDGPIPAEDDANLTVGDPQGWHDALVAAKGGYEDAIVVAGIMAWDNVSCIWPETESPNFVDFVDLFSNGVKGSVCDNDFAATFSAAVSIIDQTCDEFVPEG